MNKFKVSIITPTLNSEKDIESCILSVANQSYKNIEHIIIDGLSTDKTLEIVKKYSEKYTHIKLISEKDNGIYDAMNKGIDLVQGEWVYFMGSDDIFYDGNVLKDIFSQDEYKNYDIIYGNVYFKNSQKIYDGEFSTYKLINKNICHQGIFQKNKIYNIFGKYEIKYKAVADWVFNMKWFNSKIIKYKFINKIIAIYNEDGYSFNNQDEEFTKNKDEIIRKEFSSDIFSSYKMQEKIKAIAFYLPQFHTIPENNKWWGSGFTEWINVKKAKPLFEGHYQPHEPTKELGYYDLQNIEVQKKQSQMAKDYGIYGFCYYHYWFDGKKLLETPLNNLLKHTEINFPFCVCWANENWTRKWDGLENEILIKQNYSEKDDLDFINDLIPIFKDSRYITINGKPLLILYRPNLLPNAKKTTDIWREQVKKYGISDLYIVKVENFDKYINPNVFGCDASITFAPNWDNSGEIIRFEKPKTFSYDSLIEKSLIEKRDYPFFRCVTPSWDNAARRQDGGGITFINASPEKYKYWLKFAIKATMQEKNNFDENIVFINAWNEWGEGAHLEPDKKFGFRWLEATKFAIENGNLEFNEKVMFDYDLIINNSIMNNKIKILENNIKDKDQKVQSKDETIQQKNQEIDFKINELSLIYSSRSWKVILLIRKILSIFIPVGSFRRKIAGYIYRFSKKIIKFIYKIKELTSRILRLIKKALFVLKRDGILIFIKKVNKFIFRNKFIHEQPNKIFDIYLKKINSFLNNKDDGIIIISHDATKTGAPLLALNMAKSLKINFKKNVVIILLQSGPLEEEFKKYGIVVNLSHMFFSSITNREQNNADYLFKELSKVGINKCICNTVLSGVLMPFLEKYNFSTINLIHEQSGSIKKYNYIEATKKVLSYANKIVFSSNFVKDDFEKNFQKFNKEIFIRPQGIYLKNTFDNKEEAHKLLRKKLNIESNAKIIYGCGNGDVRKGVDLFFEIANQITNKNRELKCYFVWMGEWDELLKAKLLKIAKKKGFLDRIILIDFEKDPSIFFAGSDIFLLPSREDPFPSVVLNAMDCGTPVIVFDKAGGAPEILTNQQGVIVPYLDADSMREEILNLLKNKEFYEMISNNSKKAVKEKFIFEDYVKFLLEQLQSNNQDIIKNNNLNKLRVSVIVPNYNYENFLEERLNSIINQTYKPYEIIFLDDNSQDNSVELAKKILATSNIPYKIIKNTINKGCFSQWSKGIHEEKGDIVWIAEADDSCEPTLLERLIEKFDDPEVGLAYSQSVRIDEHGTKGDTYLSYLEEIPGSGNRWRSDFVNTGINEIRDYLVIKNTITNASAVLMRRDLLLKLEEPIGGGLMQAGDWFTYVKILQNSKIAFCSQILNYHRYHDKNIVSRSGKPSEEKGKQLVSETLIIQNLIHSEFLISKWRSSLALEHTQLVCKNNLEREIYFPPEFADKIKIFSNIDSFPKKRILFFSTNDYWGGSEVSFVKIAQAFSTNDYSVALCVKKFDSRPELLKNIISENKISLFERIEMEDYCNSKNLKDFIENFVPDMIFISQGHIFEGGFLMKWCQLNGYNYVNFVPLITEHHLEIINPSKEAILQNGKLLQLSKMIFSDNKPAQSIVKKIFGLTFNNFSVIRNAFDVPYNQKPIWNNKSDEFYKLIFIGRLHYIHKGLDILLEVLSMKKWKDRPLQIMAYGEGSDRKIMEKYIKKNNIKNFFFCGYTENLEKEIIKYQGAIFPSRMEGTPISLVDAMLCYRMAIVTPVGGMPEFIKNGITGFVADEPTVKGLDDCMERAWEKRNEWEKMGETAGVEVRKLVSEFPQQQCIDIINKILK